MTYVYSLVSGLLFGIGYGLLGLKSPAPPLIALVGLLGMLGGDQLVSQLKDHLASRNQSSSISAPGAPGSTGSPNVAAPDAAKSDKGSASEHVRNE
jgi:XapX domain-containing protein